MGRAKQLNVIISEINQLSWHLSKSYDKAKVQDKMKNLYLLYTNLIWIAVFNKDTIDLYNMNCMLRFQIVSKFSVNFFSGFRSHFTEQLLCTR